MSSKRLWLLPCAVMCGLLQPLHADDELNAFESYVLEPDDSYSWSVESSYAGLGVTNVVIELTSQTWLTKEEVDRTVWKHWLLLTIPAGSRSNKAVLYVNGGDNSDEPPPSNIQLGLAAISTASVIADLRTIPNQPIVFHNDGVARTEDDLIAYAWRHYLDTGDTRFIPQGPMVKAAIRAMDAITEYMASEAGGERTIDEFVVTGGSKRGHVTWLTGALDDRVIGIAPLVIDLLNTRESFLHHFATYGFWAAAVNDYVYHGVVQEVDCIGTQELIEMLDPAQYLDRLELPKLVVSSMGDQYFLPDSSRFYWDELQGDKYLRYLPNVGHDPTPSDFLTHTLLSFYMLLKDDLAIPQYSWRHNADGTFEVTSDIEPTEVRLWQGTNELARDFRISTFGESFTSELVSADTDGSYRVTVDVPEVGWTAYMMELTWDMDLLYPLKLTTQTYVVPDVVPYPYKARNLPTTITLLCDASSQNQVNQLKNYLADVDASAYTDGDLTVENRGTRLYINWKPNGPFSNMEVLTDDLNSRDCSVVTYQLESGDEITFPPNDVN